MVRFPHINRASDSAQKEDIISIQIAPKPEARWFNAFGEPVDLDDIDRTYALNILSMKLSRMGRRGATSDEIKADPLVQKLRSVIIHGRDTTTEDRRRARIFNARCAAEGLPFRAEVV